MKRERPGVIFLIDTREQLGYSWDSCARSELCFVACERRTLSEGDYGIELVDHGPLLIRGERKSHGDLAACCTGQRTRFTAEFARLQQFERRYIAVEASGPTILRGYERSKVNGRTIAASLMSFVDEYGVIPLMDDSRELALKRKNFWPISGIDRRKMVSGASFGVHSNVTPENTKGPTDAVDDKAVAAGDQAGFLPPIRS